jgi:general secretion pathway protein G
MACTSSKYRTRGFTLLELLVVLVILGLLAAYVGPKYFSQLSRSETTVANSQIQALQRALDSFRIDNGRYPTTEEGLPALTQRPSGLDKWNGPYLQKVAPRDPWGRPYTYRSPGPASDYEVTSLGKDGQPGGSGESADLAVP